MQQTTKKQNIMKRVIDFLTLVTIGLTVMATMWSVDSFGQVAKSRTHQVVDLEVDQTVISFMKTEFEKVDELMEKLTTELKGLIDKRFGKDAQESTIVAPAPRQMPVIETKDQINCDTFEFMGETYFNDPEAYYVDSCLTKKGAPTGYFEFMGGYYPELPEEKVEVGFTF